MPAVLWRFKAWIQKGERADITVHFVLKKPTIEILFPELNYKSTHFVTPARLGTQHTAHCKPAKKEALRIRRSGPCSENARLGLQSCERPTRQNVKYT